MKNPIFTAGVSVFDERSELPIKSGVVFFGNVVIEQDSLNSNLTGFNLISEMYSHLNLLIGGIIPSFRNLTPEILKSIIVSPSLDLAKKLNPFVRMLRDEQMDVLSVTISVNTDFEKIFIMAAYDGTFQDGDIAEIVNLYKGCIECPVK